MAYIHISKDPSELTPIAFAYTSLTGYLVLAGMDSEEGIAGRKDYPISVYLY